MDEPLVEQVEQMFQYFVTELGDTFSWTLLLAEVTFLRKKPVRVEVVPLPIGVTGACFAFRDTDVILVRTGLDPLRSLATRLHECAHLVLGHVPRYTATYADFLHSPNLRAAIYRDRTTAYDGPQEEAAETLATLLLACVKRAEERVSPAVLDLWDREA